MALKWRPQTFEEVVGQQTVTRTLQNAIRSGRVAHAFLFSGVRGVGKTTTARILAKALNCHQGVTSTPCGDCVSCREIAAGNSLDVLEIDAASNTGVDNIRELRENVRYAPARDRFKIFIIDEVHMLSNAAFNALLKTLEEPPAHVKFILATTEHHKIPATITSRCQPFDFRSIPFRLILEQLKRMAREEGVEISDDALSAVASAAQGSMRDAQSALDQMIAFCGRTVHDEDALVLLGVVDHKVLGSVVDAVFKADKTALLKQIQEVASYGIQAQSFCRGLITHVRNLMVCKVTGGDDRLLHLPDAEKDTLLEQAGRFSELDLIRFYDVLNRAENELRWNPHPYVHLEMALMKLIELARLPALEEVIRKLEGRSEIWEAPSRASQQKAASLFPEIESGPAPHQKNPSPRPLEVEQPPPVEAGVKAEQKLLSQFLQLVQMEAIRLYSSLQHASRTFFENGKLFIVFPAGEEFHYKVISDVESLNHLKRLGARVAGSSVQIDVRVEKASPQKAPASPVEDPKIQAFIEKFPGKVIVEKKGED